MRVTTSTKAMWMAPAVIAMTFALASAAQAAAARTFVNAISGSDANTGANCALTTPCKTFSAAYGVTSSGGEIVAQTPGGYGSGLTITTPVTISGEGIAEVMVPAGATGFTINAPGAQVLLKGIQITGSGLGTNTGISLTAGRLILENSTLKQLATGLNVNNPTVNEVTADIVGVDMLGNTTGVSTTGTGVDASVFPLTGPTQVRVAGGKAINNGTAYIMNNPGTGTSGNKFTVFMWTTANTSSGFETYIAGNGTLVSGTGASCSSGCTSLATFQSGFPLN